jgi:uroporphyrinogen decarboxylase
MTNKEHVLKAFHFEEVPNPPFAVLAGYTWICKQHGLSPLGVMQLPDAGAQITVDAYREMGSQIMYAGGQFGFPQVSIMGGKVNDDIIGSASEIVERPLKQPEDIEKFDLDEVIARVKESQEYKLSVAQVKNMRKIVGDDEIIAVGGYGAFTIASQFLGVDVFMENLMDDEDGYLEKAMRFAMEINMAFNEGMVEAGGDLVIIPEPVASGDLISQSMFEEFVLPITRETVERTKKFCPNVLLHICGNTSVRVASLVDMDFSVFSVDSIDMTEACKNADNKFALMGNLSPAGVVFGLDADGVYKKSMELCASLKDHPGFILAPGCDLAPDTPLENIQAMARAAKDSKK